MNESRRILADYDEEGIWVYQAFRPATVAAAVAKGTFGKGFGFDRMTWIKPSFGWMLHRSRYASMHRQEAIARIKVRRSGFDEILQSAVLTSFEPAAFSSEAEWEVARRASHALVQWDPDRDLHLRPLDRRAIQIGLRGPFVYRYVDDWILGIEEVTDLAKTIERAIEAGAPLPPVPDERPYPVSPEIRRALGM